MSIDPIFRNPRFKWIAAEWEECASDLALWGLKNLVNRFDVWGQYTIRSDKVGRTVGAVTLPRAELRGKNKDMVSLEKLERHFKGKKASHLIGLHCVSEEETCRWMAIDVDVHDEAEFERYADANFSAMLSWLRKLREDSLDPCLIDSNGMGGYHLLTLFDDPHPLKEVYKFIKNLVGDHKKFGLKRTPECFPSSETTAGLGKWLRLPGRHHTREHFSKVWSDEDFENSWIEGRDAVNHLTSLRPAPLPRSDWTSPDFKVKATDSARERRSVCVDLDGVLAAYHGWKGIDQIGRPIEGAREFLEALISRFDVIIYTSRFSSDRIASTDDLMRLKSLVVGWLEENSMPYTDVFVGKGKPLAIAFVDDRAVACVPQSDRSAYKNALEKINSL